jgi:hypothetical protein
MKVHTVTFVEEPQVAILLDNRFRLLKDFPVWVDDEWIIMPEGFETDLSSVPRVPLVYYWLGGRGHKEGILHDWLYKTNMFPREDCDDIYYWALKSERKSKAVCWAMWKGVRIGAEKVYVAYGLALEEQIKKDMKTNQSLQKIEVEERIWH